MSDFDFMVSDRAPIDLLVQRAGRVRRHAREWRLSAHSQLAVLAPEPDAQAGADWFSSFLRRASHVYGDHALLWRSAEVLFGAGQIDAPHGVRALIESVYGATGLDHVPETLWRLDNFEYWQELSRRSRPATVNAGPVPLVIPDFLLDTGSA